MKFISTLVQKLVDRIKSEPVVAAGGAIGAIAAIVSWAQTNQIATWQQFVAFAVPIMITYVSRTFVTPKSNVALTIQQVQELEAAKRPNGINTQTNTPPPA